MFSGFYKLIVVFLFLVMLLSWGFLSVPYQQTVHLIQYFLLSNYDSSTQLIIIKKFVSNSSLIYFKIFLALISTIFFVLFYYFKNYISEQIHQNFGVFNQFKLITFPALWYVLIISLVLKMYFLVNLPLHLDELFSFNYLTYKGFLTTISYYPGPNNHVFYNLLVAILLMLKLPIILAIRLPSLLASLVIQYLMFDIGIRFYAQRKALLLAIVPCVANYFFFYSVQGRGYVLAIMLFIMALYFYYLHNKPTFIVVILMSLSLFTIPTMILPIISWLLFVRFYKQSRLKDIIKLMSFMFVFTLLFYSPILFVTGKKALFMNGWVNQHLSFGQFISSLPAQMMHYFQFFTGVDYLWVLLLLIPMVLIFKKSVFNVFFVCNIIIFLAWILLMKQFPFSRIFLFIHLLFYIFWVVNLEKWILLQVFLLLAVVNLTFNMYQTSDFILSQNIENQKLNTVFTNSKPYKKLSCKNEYDYYYFQFLNIEHKSKLQFVLNQNQDQPFQYIK